MLRTIFLFCIDQGFCNFFRHYPPKPDPEGFVTP